MNCWPNIMTLFRDEFKNRREYLEAYHNACNHYDFKVRVFGGWKFFAFFEDYDLWKRTN